MKNFLKKNWKSLAIISGIGVGGAMIAIGKGRGTKAPSPQLLPTEVTEILLRTQLEGMDAGRRILGEYRLQKTRYQVWETGQDRTHRSHPVFFIMPFQRVLSENEPERVIQKDPFYAMVGIPSFSGKGDLLDHVLVGAPVLFQPCLVGSGLNSSISGDKIVTQGLLESWEPLVLDI